MPTFHIHHRLILCLLGLWKQHTVFPACRREGTPKSVRRHVGPMGRDGSLCTHTLSTLPLRTIHVYQLSAGPLLPRERGWSPTPLRPLELGSGAQVTSQIHKENIIAYTSTPKYRRPCASAPVGRTTPPMMGSVLLSRGDCLPKECLRIRKVGLLPCWFYCNHTEQATLKKLVLGTLGTLGSNTSPLLRAPFLSRGRSSVHI